MQLRRHPELANWSHKSFEARLKGASKSAFDTWILPPSRSAPCHKGPTPLYFRSRESGDGNPCHRFLQV